MFAIPAFLTGAQGFLIRIALMGLALGGMFLWGLTVGYMHEEKKLDVFNAQVKLIGQQQIARNAADKARYEENRKTVEADYEDQLDFLARWHDSHPRVVLRHDSSGGATGTNAASPGGANAAASEPGAPGRDSPSTDAGEGDTVEVSPGFVFACAKDAAHVNAFRAYVIKNNLPIE